MSGNAEIYGFLCMKRARISLALCGLATSAAMCAALWPHARVATAILAARDDPAELADVKLSASLQNRNLISENIESALAAHDADLANSFVELAREKNVGVGDEQAARVSAAVAEDNSTAHVAKSFATGLVTGNADD